jgi:hypothetical protein
MKVYKTKDGSQSGFVVGFGAITNGQIEVPDNAVIENANLELVEDRPEQPNVQAVSPDPNLAATPPLNAQAPNNGRII